MYRIYVGWHRVLTMETFDNMTKNYIHSYNEYSFRFDSNSIVLITLIVEVYEKYSK